MNKKVVGNVLFSLIDKGTVLLFGMIISISVARYLGAAEYGNYTYFVVVYTFVASISSFGMQQIVTKDLASNFQKQKTNMYSALIISTVTSLLTWFGVIILHIIIGFLNPFEVGLLGVACVFNICSVFRYYLIATYQLKNMIIIKNCMMIGIYIFYTILIINKMPEICFEITYIIKESCMLVVCLIAYLISKEKKTLRIQIVTVVEVFNNLKRIVRICFPLLLSGLSITIYLKIDQIMIKEMLNEVQLGIYSSAIKLVECFFNIPHAIVVGILPFFSALYVKDKNNFWISYKKLALSLNLFTYIFAIGISIFGKKIIYLLYGTEYTDASKILIIYVWSTVAVSMGCVRSIYLSIMEYSRLSFMFSLCAAITNIIMNCILIPKMGIEGAAVASVISYFLQGFIFTFFSRKLRIMSKLQIQSLYDFRCFKQEIGILMKEIHKKFI